jgi:hypothetical protein
LPPTAARPPTPRRPKSSFPWPNSTEWSRE